MGEEEQESRCEPQSTQGAEMERPMGFPSTAQSVESI